MHYFIMLSTEVIWTPLKKNTDDRQTPTTKASRNGHGPARALPRAWPFRFP